MTKTENAQFRFSHQNEKPVRNIIMWGKEEGEEEEEVGLCKGTTTEIE